MIPHNEVRRLIAFIIGGSSIRVRFVSFTILMLLFGGNRCATALSAEFSVGSAPSCPMRAGTRQFRSAELQAADIRTYIVGSASRQGATCRRTTELRVHRDGTINSIPLDTNQQDIFTIVDLSAEHSKLFVYREKIQKYPDEEFRNVDIATMPITARSVVWQSVWDLMRWNQCDAAIEPLGFTSDSKVAIRARPATMTPPRRPSCVSKAGQYEIDLPSRTFGQLAERAKITPHSKTTRSSWQTCKDDPDLTGSCFTVHGRLSAWNGAPTYRIWRIGTNRILGVSNDILPESVVGNINWNAEALGDFVVCPFSPERPGRMQQVCVESAKNLKYRTR